MKFKQNRLASLTVITIVYCLAAIAGYAVFSGLPGLPVALRLFLADLAATILIFAASAVLRNASVYDPYWSVAPIVFLSLFATGFGVISAGTLMLIAVIWYWGIRLTLNWLGTFSSLKVQDWRYDMLKARSKKFYPLVNFFGIHFFPTLVVFFAMLPAVYYIQSGKTNLLTLCGFAVCLAATTLQLVSDLQMTRCRQDTADRSLVATPGLWKYSRHPNYFGEIMMWWGVYLVMLSVLPSRWYLLLGAVLNTLMFVFISIPMIEKRMLGYKAGYDRYRQETRMLLPIRKKQTNSEQQIPGEI